jgi:uncharacterized protein (DUF1800 family)
MERRDFLKTTFAAAAVTVAGLYGLDQLGAMNSGSFSLPRLSTNMGALARVMSNGTLTTQSTQTMQTTGTTQTSSSTDGTISDDLQTAHLLRRAGFGATPIELSNYERMGYADAVNYLVSYGDVNDLGVPPTPNIVLSYSGKQTGNPLQALQTWWLQRMVGTFRPLEEKMTLFWANHFATGYSKVENAYLMYKQNDFLRRNALGNFKDILTGITADGAMLVWLDGNQSRKGNPNENYAREVMEVFSTGRGPYTQDDVTNGALAFTGYTIDANGNGVFNDKLHDHSTKTFMGVTGDLGPQDIIKILVAHPATAANLSTELFEFFAYPNPSADTVNTLAQVYLNSGYDIRALVEAILLSPEFLSSQAYLANVKSPAEYIATSLRSLGATANLNGAVAAMTNMGQALFNPPSVFGWPSGEGWINTASVLERYNFPPMIQTTQENAASRLDANQDFGAGTQDVADVQAIAATLFPDGVPTDLLQVVSNSTSAMTTPVLKTKDAVRLIMATPFYNLN